MGSDRIGGAFSLPGGPCGPGGGEVAVSLNFVGSSVPDCAGVVCSGCDLLDCFDEVSLSDEEGEETGVNVSESCISRRGRQEVYLLYEPFSSSFAFCLLSALPCCGFHSF